MNPAAPMPSMPPGVERLEPPRCPRCGGRIRPCVVWFGEALPQGPWRRAMATVGDADLLLVVGTSGVVQPAAGLADRRGIGAGRWW
ncbi:Sir2 family NAD-dependent protein deacetylase [uncultured Pseudacidovorax sp.]|uniref:Sir2 family NAD-dependent protein deacetylase n=1 Tax=uncultured Pseudacidovorax sp. TaxID=679313 RepID=UPI0025DB6DDC|nr:Sir2 family NAD-dependent protein deacetylase [uncultured Pseudacidovorax sp.]